MIETNLIDELIEDFFKDKKDILISYISFLDIVGSADGSTSKRAFINNKYFNPNSKHYLGIPTIGNRSARKILLSDAMKFTLVMSSDAPNLNLDGIMQALMYANRKRK